MRCIKIKINIPIATYLHHPENPTYQDVGMVKDVIMYAYLTEAGDYGTGYFTFQKNEERGNELNSSHNIQIQNYPAIFHYSRKFTWQLLLVIAGLIGFLIGKLIIAKCTYIHTYIPYSRNQGVWVVSQRRSRIGVTPECSQSFEIANFTPVSHQIETRCHNTVSKPYFNVPFIFG